MCIITGYILRFSMYAGGTSLSNAATERSKLTYLDIIGWYIHVITSYAEWYNFQPPPQMCE